MSAPIRTIGKNGVELTEYKSEYGLTACYEGKDGKFYQQWGKVKVGKDVYSDKDRPVKVILGDRGTAIATLNMLISELTHTASGTKPPISDEDVPF